MAQKAERIAVRKHTSIKENLDVNSFYRFMDKATKMEIAQCIAISPPLTHPYARNKQSVKQPDYLLVNTMQKTTAILVWETLKPQEMA
jgi:hypothetical protein